jgi:hypothetical protein
VSAHDPQTGLPFSYSITTLDTALPAPLPSQENTAATALPYLTRAALPQLPATPYSPYLSQLSATPYSPYLSQLSASPYSPYLPYLAGSNAAYAPYMANPYAGYPYLANPYLASPYATPYYRPYGAYGAPLSWPLQGQQEAAAAKEE